MAKNLRNDGNVTALPMDGGARMQRRRAKPQDITEEMQETFFATLADSCNVSLSARAAGFAANWAYRKRRTDARFRHQWAAAVREGYAKLELELLRRAIEGTPKTVRHKDGSDETIREYSNTLAIALLRRHAETIDSMDGLEDDGSHSELRGKIMEQLDRLREREGGDGVGDFETKNAAGRLALLRRLLGPILWD